MSQRAATSHAPCVYSLEYSGASPVTISPHPSPSAVSARTTMTSRTVSVPNDVVNGETSGRCSTRSSKPSRATDAAGRAMGMRSGYARAAAGSRGSAVPRSVGAGAPGGRCAPAM